MLHPRMKAKTNFRLITRFQPFNLVTVQLTSLSIFDKSVSKSLLVITAIGLKILSNRSTVSLVLRPKYKFSSRIYTPSFLARLILSTAQLPNCFTCILSSLMFSSCAISSLMIIPGNFSSVKHSSKRSSCSSVKTVRRRL